MALALSSLQTGHIYRIKNYGEVIDFEVVNIRPDYDFEVKHIHTLEKFLLSEITRYGKGADYDLREIH